MQKYRSLCRHSTTTLFERCWRFILYVFLALKYGGSVWKFELLCSLVLDLVECMQSIHRLSRFAIGKKKMTIKTTIKYRSRDFEWHNSNLNVPKSNPIQWGNCDGVVNFINPKIFYPITHFTKYWWREWWTSIEGAGL